ncbi:hypothetical protein Jab_1c00400 [Janthinobacterium sp. HH01]|uniref:putative type VI secretion system effector n=1 Tax=Janthinobacterium sp. HH01 TaxID=1198452 RepID=UPI0002AE9B02|nr:putative type VI secretion system effector [Janthinobacterium sp. HH01]ELX11457.1 hypothetical protein Jab_1c00400 [Janthinobacterium sp. HH01]
MQNFIKPPSTSGLIKLSGKISDYIVTRDRASFVFTESDQTKLGVIAIAASLVGMGGQAMSVASSTTSMEEDADYVQFTVNGKMIKGWLWRSPFKNGDEVDIAAEWQADHYELFGIARPEDRTISLYPHCSRAKTRHIKNAIKWWLIVSIFLELGISAIFLTDGWSGLVYFWKGLFAEGGWWLPVGLTAFCAIAIASMTKQWMPFVRLSERVFSALALPDPRNIDLVKSSKGKKTETDTLEFGSMYFRY